MRQDNYVVRKQFQGLVEGSNGQVRLTTGEVDEEELITATASQSGHNNGGGEELTSLRAQVSELQAQLASRTSNGSNEGDKGDDPRDSLTIPQIKEQLDAKQVAYSSTANKAELLELLKAQPATQE